MCNNHHTTLTLSREQESWIIHRRSLFSQSSSPFQKTLMALANSLKPSPKPSPVTAQQGCKILSIMKMSTPQLNAAGHSRPRNLWSRSSRSRSSDEGHAVGTSCLFANTKTGTLARSLHSKRELISSFTPPSGSVKRSRSAESTTKT